MDSHHRMRMDTLQNRLQDEHRKQEVRRYVDFINIGIYVILYSHIVLGNLVKGDEIFLLITQRDTHSGSERSAMLLCIWISMSSWEIANQICLFNSPFSQEKNQKVEEKVEDSPSFSTIAQMTLNSVLDRDDIDDNAFAPEETAKGTLSSNAPCTLSLFLLFSSSFHQPHPSFSFLSLDMLLLVFVPPQCSWNSISDRSDQGRDGQMCGPGTCSFLIQY